MDPRRVSPRADRAAQPNHVRDRPAPARAPDRGEPGDGWPGLRPRHVGAARIATRAAPWATPWAAAWAATRAAALIGGGLLALLALLSPPATAEPGRRLPPAAAAASPAAGAAATTPAFNRPLAEATLREAIAALVERHLDPQTPAALAAQALSALGALDPALGLAASGREIALRRDGRTLAQARRPADGDIAGWAQLVAGFAAGAAEGSATIGRAGTAAVVRAMLDATTARLDPYTRYMPPPEARAARGQRRGEGGIGVRAVPAADGAAIIEVIPESPADHAGLAEGDRILAIDGRRLRGLSEEAIAILLAGEEDSRLVLTLRPRRGGAARQVAVIRALIVPQTVTLERAGPMAVFRVSAFNRLTDQHLARALLDAQAASAGLSGIVLDLRGNRGGLLRQAVSVVDLFVAEGEIVATRGRHPDAARTYVAGGADLAGTTPLVVLVDGDTASAAEIVAASLQARGRAAVVGSATMGKGLVQTVIRLPDDGELVLTWSRVLVPPGVPLLGLGVLPDLCTASGPEAAAAALAALRAGRAPAAPAQAERRALGPRPDAAQLAGLRATCPARAGEAADIDAGLALLADARAMATALGRVAETPMRAGGTAEHLAGAR